MCCTWIDRKSGRCEQRLHFNDGLTENKNVNVKLINRAEIEIKTKSQSAVIKPLVIVFICSVDVCMIHD